MHPRPGPDPGPFPGGVGVGAGCPKTASLHPPGCSSVSGHRVPPLLVGSALPARAVPAALRVRPRPPCPPAPKGARKGNGSRGEAGRPQAGCSTHGPRHRLNGGVWCFIYLTKSFWHWESWGLPSSGSLLPGSGLVAVAVCFSGVCGEEQTAPLRLEATAGAGRKQRNAALALPSAIFYS